MVSDRTAPPAVTRCVKTRSRVGKCPLILLCAACSCRRSKAHGLRKLEVRPQSSGATPSSPLMIEVATLVAAMAGGKIGLTSRAVCPLHLDFDHALALPDMCGFAVMPAKPGTIRVIMRVEVHQLHVFRM